MSTDTDLDRTQDAPEQQPAADGGDSGYDDPILTKTIDRCKITRKLGQGGMGVVYLAKDETLGQEFCLKILNPALVGSEDTVERFFREAQACAQLNHPGIVAIQNVGQEGEYYFIRMEYVEGDTIEDMLKNRSQPLGWRRAVEMVIHTAEALAHAHSKGMIHRDIKPENLMVTPKGEVKVMDFGLAKHVHSSAKVSVTGQIVGTPFFMSPEQAGGKPTDARSDIYSLGVTLYYMLTGVKPFNGKNLQEIFLKHFFYAPESPKIYNEALPDALCDIVRRCLKKKKKERYQSAKALARDLQAVLDDPSISIEDSPTPGASTEGGEVDDATIRAGVAVGGGGDDTIQAGGDRTIASNPNAGLDATMQAGGEGDFDATMQAGGGASQTVQAGGAGGFDPTIQVQGASTEEEGGFDPTIQVDGGRTQSADDDEDPTLRVGGGQDDATMRLTGSTRRTTGEIQRVSFRGGDMQTTELSKTGQIRQAQAAEDESEETLNLPGPMIAQEGAAPKQEDKAYVAEAKNPLPKILAAVLVVLIGLGVVVGHDLSKRSQFEDLKTRYDEVREKQDNKAELQTLSTDLEAFIAATWSPTLGGLDATAAAMLKNCRNLIKAIEQTDKPDRRLQTEAQQINEARQREAEEKAERREMANSAKDVLENLRFQGKYEELVEKALATYGEYNEEFPEITNQILVPIVFSTDPPGVEVYLEHSNTPLPQQPEGVVWVSPNTDVRLRLTKPGFDPVTFEGVADTYLNFHRDLTRQFRTIQLGTTPVTFGFRDLERPLSAHTPLVFEAVREGLAYFVAQDGLLHALDVGTGRANWEVTEEHRVGIFGDPTPPLYLVAGQVIFAPSSLGYLFAFDQANGGQRIWRAPPHLGSPVTSAPSYSPTNRILAVGTADGDVAFLREMDGNLHGVFRTDNAVVTPPYFQGERIVFIASTDNRVYAVDWREHLDQPLSSLDLGVDVTVGPVPVGRDLLVGTSAGDLVLINTRDPRDLSILHVLHAGQGTLAGLQVAGQTVYFGEGNTIHALSVTDTGPENLWTQTFPGAVTAPVIFEDLLYITCANGTLYCLDRETGDIRWRFHIDTESPLGKPVIFDEELYLFVDGKLFVLSAF